MFKSKAVKKLEKELAKTSKELKDIKESISKVQKSILYVCGERGHKWIAKKSYRHLVFEANRYKECSVCGYTEVIYAKEYLYLKKKNFIDDADRNIKEWSEILEEAKRGHKCQSKAVGQE